MDYTYNLEASRATNPLLPNELIIKILTLCGPREIVQCRALSKKLRDIIDQVDEVQYALELGIAGVEDVCKETYDAYPISNRIENIRALQHAWKQDQTLVEHRYSGVPDLRAFQSVTMHVGNIIIKAVDENEGNDIFYDSYNTLYCTCIEILRTPQEPANRWKLGFDFYFKCFVADPAQDVLVLLQEVTPQDTNNHTTYIIHSVSFKDGAQHYFSSITFNSSASFPNNCHGYPPDIYIYGDVAAVVLVQMDLTTLNLVDTHVTLVNWRTGSIVNSWTYGGDRQMPRGHAHPFALISDSCFAIGTTLTTTDEACYAVNVYWFDKYAGQPSEPTHVAVFKFPPLQADVSVSSGERFMYDSSGEWNSGSIHKTSFAPIPSDAILVLDNFSLARGPLRRSYNMTIIIHLSTLLEPVMMHNVRNRGLVVEPLSYSWETWGPSSTRWLDSETHDWYTGDVYGNRMYLSGFIVDFNQLEIKRDLHRARIPLSHPACDPKAWKEPLRTWHSFDMFAISQEDILSMMAQKYVLQPSVLPHNDFFKQDVVSCLLYRRVPILFRGPNAQFAQTMLAYTQVRFGLLTPL